MFSSKLPLVISLVIIRFIIVSIQKIEYHDFRNPDLMFLFIMPYHHYHQNSTKWQKRQLIWLLTKNMKVAMKKVMTVLCVMILTSMTLKVLTKKSKDLISAHLCLFVFDKINERGHKVTFFSVLSTKTSSKYLKLVSAIFYQICIFSPNDSSLKTMKNVFYFI